MAQYWNYLKNALFAGVLAISSSCTHLTPELTRDQPRSKNISQLEKIVGEQKKSDKKIYDSIGQDKVSGDTSSDISDDNSDDVSKNKTAKQNKKKQPKQPSTAALIGAGLGMGVVDYFLEATLHEGSHALVASAYGAKIEDFGILPYYKDGSLRFAHCSYENVLTDKERSLVLIMPRIVDLGIMMTYVGLLETDSLPDNKYGQLSLAILATGALVDFIKDFGSENPDKDMVKFYKLTKMNRSEKIGMMTAQGILTVATAIEIFRGYYNIFDRSERSDKKHKDKKTSLEIEPMVGIDYLGIGGTF